MKKMFVYGTLRTGMYNYEKYSKGYDSFRYYGYVKGQLHALKGKVYPALTEGERMILGEIHEVPENSGLLGDVILCDDYVKYLEERGSLYSTVQKPELD